MMSAWPLRAPRVPRRSRPIDAPARFAHRGPGVCALLAAEYLVAVAGRVPGQELGLSTVHEIVYRVADHSKRRTESWYLDVVVTGRVDRGELRLLEVRADLCAGDAVLATRILPAATLARILRTSYRIQQGLPAHDLRHRYARDEIADVALEFAQQPPSRERSTASR
jgi:hypothetical protein